MEAEGSGRVIQPSCEGLHFGNNGLGFGGMEFPPGMQGSNQVGLVAGSYSADNLLAIIKSGSALSLISSCIVTGKKPITHWSNRASGTLDSSLGSRPPLGGGRQEMNKCAALGLASFLGPVRGLRGWGGCGDEVVCELDRGLCSMGARQSEPPGCESARGC